MTRTHVALSVAAGLTLACVAPNANAQVTGHVRIRGTPPATPPRTVLRDTTACGKSQIDESLRVGPDGGLANVVVSLSAAPSAASPAPDSSAGIIDQIGCRFVPHVL